MNKKIIYNWLYNILKEYDDKEINSVCQNYIDDKIALDYIKNQYKTNKKKFEKEFLYNFNMTKVKSKNTKQDYFMIYRPKYC